MNPSYKMVLAFGLMTAFTAPALAQGPGGGYGGGGGGIGLIANESVQKELKLDEDQVRKAGVLATDARAKGQEMRSALEGLEGEALNKKRMELTKANNDEGLKTLGTFLKPEQLKRFKQIELQQAGINAFAMPGVAQALKVTDEQSEKVKALLADQRTQMAEARDAANGDRQVQMQKSAAIRKEINTKAMALMTENQKATWKEMTGEPFTLVPAPRRAP